MTKLIAVLLVLALFLAGVGGWVVNIVKLFTHDLWGTLSGELVIRIAGIPLFLLGAIAGWF